MRRVLALLIALMLATFQVPSEANAETVRLDTAKIDALVRDGMERYRIPGMAVGIAYRDQIVYVQGYGIADDNNRPVKPETPFVLGSVTKSITAIAILQLAEQGRLGLDDSVRKHLPELQWDESAEGGPVTIRHLLHQTAGLSTYTGRQWLADGDLAPAEAVDRLGRIKLRGAAGSVFRYSNANFILLGEIVTRVSGLSYEDYVEENVFGPLEMRNSFAADPEAKERGLASGYQSVFGRLKATNPPLTPAQVPAGYLASSAEDMTHYLLAQLNGGEYRDRKLLTSEGVEKMHKPAPGFPYAMGWFSYGSRIWHGGDTANFHADVIADLDAGWGIVVLMNTNDALKTTVYGNAYGELSDRLLEAAIRGGGLPGFYPPAIEFGPIDEIVNAILGLAALWIAGDCILMLNRHRRRRGSFGVGRLRTLVGFLAMGSFYFALPLTVLIGVPKVAEVPWAVLLSLCPGSGHGLMFLSFALLVLGSAKVIANRNGFRFIKRRNMVP